MKLNHTWVTPTIRERHEAAGLWVQTTWIDELRDWVTTQPDDVAVIDEDGETMTVAALYDSARRLAAWMQHIGVRSGDVISMTMPNWREHLVIHAATGLVGGITNPMIPGLGESDIAHVL